mmetsp:Transcript_72268/g.202828  ORF Transcript_72268/g.202828 Transcript_72268/m.202828 type:complete len:233 (+) Transcript_72268:1161-1859(+)
MLPSGKRAKPEAAVRAQLPQRGVRLQAIEQVRDLLAPPLNHEPSGRLLLLAEQLVECTLLFLRRRLDEPVVDLMEVHGVDAEFRPRPGVAPPVAMLRGPTEDVLELREAQGPVLRRLDIALELELFLQLVQVPGVVATLEGQPRQTLRLGLDLRGPRSRGLRPDGHHVRDEMYEATSPLPLGFLEAPPNLFAAVDNSAIDHVDFPAGPDTLLFGLTLYNRDDGALPLEPVVT